MFQSQCLLSRKGPSLGAISVAAYFFKKLKKSQVFQTDISSSVDKILQDELNAVTYRVMAYLLLGIVRIYSRKVEYLYVDCNKVLTEINEFVVSTKDSMRKEALQAPYYAITLPDRFELDAFDLGILEDATESNILSQEEITLKDNMWKNKVTQLFDENHGEEITAVDNICYFDDTLFEDVFSPHLKDVERVASTSQYQIMPETSQGCTFSHEKYEVEVSIGIENAYHNTVELFDEDHRSHEEMFEEETGQYKNVVPEASNEMVLTSRFCHEENVTIETVSRMENESSVRMKSSDEDHQSEGLCRELVQSENKLQIVNEGDFSDSQRSMETLRDNTITLVDSVDIDMSCGVTYRPPDFVGMDSEEHDLKSLEMKSPEKRDHDDTRDKLQLAISLDGNSDFVFPDFTGTNAPEFTIIPTPANKERSRTRTLRKRRCIVDDCIVLPNKKLKQSIYDASDLVFKRRKGPLNALSAWKARRISELSSGFLVPLMSCVSSELRSLLCEMRVNILHSAEMVIFPQNLDSPSSPISAMLEKTDHLQTNPRTGDYSDVPDMSVSMTTNRSEEITNYTERVCETSVLERLCASEPQNLDRPEQIEMAPGTPVRCSTSARSFRTPESPKVSNLNAIKFSEVDDQETDGWSGRTRMVAGYLLQNFTNQGVQSLKEAVKLSDLLSEKTKRESASVFYEILVLKTKECVDVKQDCAYGDILVWRSLNWDTSFGTNRSLTCGDPV